MNKNKIQQKVEEEILNNYKSMYRIAYSYMKNEEDALDVIQESSYKAIKNAKKIQEEKYIKTWIHRIVINTAIDFLRKKKIEVVTEDIEEIGMEDKYQDFDTIKALNILDEKEKAVIILRFFEQHKIYEIAKIIGVNENTVKTILYRGLKKLKVELTKEGRTYV